MALKHHPDKVTMFFFIYSFEKTYKQFKEINNANAILSDENKRKIYDTYGKKGLELAEQFGEENFVKYILGDNRYCVFFRVLFEVSFRKNFEVNQLVLNKTWSQIQTFVF